MIRLRHFIILGLLAVADWLIRINERALGVNGLPPLGEHVTVSEHSEPSIAGRILLASLVGMSIALTWLWFVVRAMP